jgi:hypothetical protein
MLGNLKAKTGNEDGGINALAEGMRCLAPVFEAYPAAAAALMAALLKSYTDRCKAANREPDNGLVAAVAAGFQRMEAAGAAIGQAGSGARPVPVGL